MRDLIEVFGSEALLRSSLSLSAERATDEELEELERYLVETAELIEDKDFAGVVEVDTDFHSYYIRPVVITGWLRLSIIFGQIQRFRRDFLLPGPMKEALEEHRKIVEAISDRNPELASKIRKSILKTLKTV